jgi:hypothetical protein
VNDSSPGHSLAELHSFRFSNDIADDIRSNSLASGSLALELSFTAK